LRGKTEKETLLWPVRFRFSDTLIGFIGTFGQLFDKPEPLKIVASPEISSTGFYLQYPIDDYTNFDKMKHEVGKERIQPIFKVSLKGVITGRSFNALLATISSKTVENESQATLFYCSL